MKKILLLTVFFAACSSRQAEYVKAENALDAGREFINACLQGDFSKAAFYMVPAEPNQRKLAETEKDYREKDKEGRQQLRTASININEVKELGDTATLIVYSYSFDKLPKTIRVIKQKDGWLVNFADNNPVP